MTEKTSLNIEQQKKINQVYISYLKWFIGSGCLAIMGTVAAYFLNIFYPLPGFLIKGLQIFSLVVEAASLGQCGYNIQTWGGISPAEKLNEKLFAGVSSIGFFLIIFSFKLEGL